MKIAVISDVHGNIHALEPVLEQIESIGFDRVICCGDLVGYGAFPNEVIEYLEASDVDTLRGSYDLTVAFDQTDGEELLPCESATQHRLAHMWSLREVTAENKAFLRTLPFRSDIRLGKSLKFVAVHSAPNGATDGDYRDRPEHLFGDFVSDASGGIVVFGRTHVAFERSVGDVRFISCGSVGLPCDGDVRACYACIEISNGDVAQAEVTFRRVKYDYETAARAVERKGLPANIAQFIRCGGAVESLARV
jgi:predicted phosphodiesterase